MENSIFFWTKLELILQKLHYMNLYIICEDININYLTDSIKRSQLYALLLSYNLQHSHLSP